MSDRTDLNIYLLGAYFSLCRYLLAVLPYRGSKAFKALLEALQDANAQHVVDLLLEQNFKHTLKVKETIIYFGLSI